MIFERKKIEIDILGKTLYLTESNAKDFIDLTQFIIENNQNKDLSFLVYQNAYSIHNALIYNVTIIPKWRIIKRIKMKQLISVHNLMKELSSSEINKLSGEVSILEGLKVSKKKVELNQSS